MYNDKSNSIIYVSIFISFKVRECDIFLLIRLLLHQTVRHSYDSEPIWTP